MSGNGSRLHFGVSSSQPDQVAQFDEELFSDAATLGPAQHLLGEDWNATSHEFNNSWHVSSLGADLQASSPAFALGRP